MVDPHVAKNFRRSEFACPCCDQAIIKPDLPVALQEHRDLLGSAVAITSGFRCQKKNTAVGGKSNSCHMYGYAADCYHPGVDLLTAYLNATRCLPWANGGGLGLYVPYWQCENEDCEHKFMEDSDCPKCSGKEKRRRGNFLHLDTRKKRRRWGQILGVQCSLDKALLELKGSEHG